MKTTYKSFRTQISVVRILFLLVLSITIFSQKAVSQNVGISSTGATPDASAMLDIVSTSKGLLIPRVALTATNAAGPITSPVTSLLVYNSATAGTTPNNVVPGYYYWNGSAWVALLTASNTAWTLTGNSGTTAGTNFIGTTDGTDLVFKTNSSESMRIYNGAGVELSSGTGSGTSSGDALFASGTYNNFLEINVQNLSSGSKASADIVATADNGSSSSFYIDMGINGSGYSTGSSNILNGANLAYLYANAGNMIIGNGTPNKDMIFFTNPSNGSLGTNTANGIERLRITESGKFGVGTTVNTSSAVNSTLEVVGSAGYAITTTSGNITLDDTHYTVIITTGSTPTITLPAAASTNNRRIYIIVNQSSGSRTISTYKDLSGTNATTIAATSSITLQSNGSSWYRVQ